MPGGFGCGMRTWAKFSAWSNRCKMRALTSGCFSGLVLSPGCLLATECHRIYPTTAKSHGLAIGPTLRLFFGVFGGLHLHRVIAFDVILVLRRGITTSSLSLRLLLCFQLITWHWDKSGSCVSRLNQTSGNPSRASQTVYLGFFKFNIPYWILERMLGSGFGLVCFFPFSWMCFFFH